MNKEQPPVNTDAWYGNLVEIAALPPVARYSNLVKLHEETLERYLSQINNITEERAIQISSDRRTIKDVVAHIMAWEDWQIQELSDPNIKSRLAKGLKYEGYVDSDSGKELRFKDDDDFNAYVTRRFKDRSWPDIKRRAVETAKRLQSFFPKNAPQGWIDFLETTPLYTWRLPDATITIPSGWYIWMISLEHEAVEHRKDLSAV